MAFNLVYLCEIDISGTRLTKYNTDGSIVSNDTLNNTIWSLDNTGLRLNDPTTFEEISKITDDSVVINSLENAGQQVEILAGQISVKSATLDDRKSVISSNSYNVKQLDDTEITNLSEFGLNITNSVINGVNMDDTINKTSLTSDTLDFGNSDNTILYARLQQSQLYFQNNPNTNTTYYGLDNLEFKDISGASVIRRCFLDKTSLILYDASQNPITTLDSNGLTAKVKSTLQATLDATCSLSLIEGTTTGSYTPIFDSGLTYNPSTNLLSVSSLALSTSVNTPSFATGVLTIDCAFASAREFSYAITANITGLNLTNRRTNGVYKIAITNNSGATRTINSTLTGTSTNKTNYNPPGNAGVVVGEFFVMTVQVLSAGGADVNFVNLIKYV